MNARITVCLFIAALFHSTLSSACDGDGERTKIKAKTTVAALQEDDYDVQYVKLDVSATNASTAISGHATTMARVVAASMNDYYFELSNQLTIDSAKINGQSVSVTQVNNFVNKTSVASPLAQNTVFTADIYYHGAPTGGTGFFTNGILHQTDATVPVDVTHTVSAAFHSRDWWPCKQSLTDKIDSADFWITVPTGLKVAGNGLLQNVTTVAPGFERYEWASRYPVDYYLLSFAVAPYAEYNYYMHFTGSNDSMLVQNYIYNDPAVLQQHQDELDTIGHIINYFSSLFGRYPYDKEKFGICMTPLAGGMENQTMVSLGSLDVTLIAHELSHQWWGDNVTCESLHDMWLNEGWAAYCEQLYIEHFWGKAAMISHRTSVYNYILSSLGGTVWVDDTTQEGRIYYDRLTYDKGSALAHMLRYMVNDDTLFFQAIRTYQQQYKYKTATTEGLKNIVEQVSGADLDTFFSQWFNKPGYPIYGAKWYQSGGQVILKLTQTTSLPLQVPVFMMPVDIQLKSPQGDTTFRLYNDHKTQYYTLNWNKPVTSIVIDPEDNILNKVSSITQDSTVLDIATPGRKQISVYPNPSTSSWRVSDVPANAVMTLTDINGRKVWSTTSSSDTVQVPCGSLPAGTYILSIKAGEEIHSFQLFRDR